MLIESSASTRIDLAGGTRLVGELLYSPKLRPHPHVEFARLGPHAGAIGAALLDTAA